MKRDFATLSEQYPDIISAEQLYRICHISKRKATWLLEHGVIPCQDSGKKTRRFKIRLEDVITYLRLQETNQLKVSVPTGIFSNRSARKANPLSQINNAGFQRYFYTLWSAEPDALTPAEVQLLIGYSRNTIGQWLVSGKLKCIKLPSQEQVIAKHWLVEFISAYTVQNPGRLSPALKQIAINYLQDDR